MPSLKARIVTALPESLVMHIQALDHYFNGEMELRLLRNLVEAGRPAIDAGANIGTYSYFMRGYATKVHAYEPNPELAQRLKRIMPGIFVHQAALSDACKQLRFSLPVNEKGRSMHELGSIAQRFEGQTKEFSVECVSIDSENFDDVGFIKIDVEQHEREVLRGAACTIARCRPTILVEVYPLKYERRLAEEFSFILDQNYCAWFSFDKLWHDLDTLNQALHTAPENFGKVGRFMGNNLVFFPREHRLANFGPAR